VYDVIYPNGTDAQKPHENNWCKQEPNPVGAIMLKGKQANEYGARNWNFHICKIIEFFRWQYHSKRQSWTVCTVPMVIAVRMRKEAASYERDCFFKLGNSVWHFSTGWSHLSYFLQFQFEFVNIIFFLIEHRSNGKFSNQAHYFALNILEKIKWGER